MVRERCFPRRGGGAGRVLVFAVALCGFAGGFAAGAAPVRLEVNGAPAAGVPWALVRPAPGPDGRVVVARGRSGADGTLAAGAAREGGGLLLAVRVADTIVAVPWPSVGPVSLEGRRLTARVLDARDGRPVAGASLRCIDEQERPAPRSVRFRAGVTEAPEVLGTGTGGEEYLPAEPGAIAFTGADGRARLFLPPRCTGVLVAGDPGRYRARIVAPAGESPLEIRLERSGGIVLRMEAPGDRADARGPVRIAVWPAPLRPGGRPRSTMQRYGTEIRVPLPPGGPWFVLVSRAGFAPVLIGPVRADEGWPRRRVHAVRGAPVTWTGVDDPAGGELLDEEGRNWWPLLTPARGRGGALTVGPLPWGRWRYRFAGGRCRGEIVLGPGARGPRIPCSPAGKGVER